MPPARKRPPYSADERAQLLGWLDLQRAIIHWNARDCPMWTLTARFCGRHRS
jgi:hypothetical protein